LFTWGYGDDGSVGAGNQDSCDSPYLVEALIVDGERIVDVDCGASHIAVINSYGNLFTWGSDEYGQLGHGEESAYCELLPKRVELKDPTLALSCGLSHTIIQSHSGEVFSCGDNTEGQLGIGHTVSCHEFQ
jgi:alpha-tubulin suppressor-like RCC1 family protein